MGQWNWNDSVNFLSKLTARRVWNMTKVYSSYYISKWAKRPVQWGMPVSISFEPTTSCNLRCPECPSGLRAFTRPTGMLRRDFFRETIDQLYKDLSYLVFYFQGEPFLNPDFLEMVKYAASRKIYTATSTNAHYLKDAVAKRTVESG
jgi:MoaA/NifB/PqqE/SkfB family radical SAM enzyme